MNGRRPAVAMSAVPWGHLDGTVLIAAYVLTKEITSTIIHTAALATVLNMIVHPMLPQSDGIIQEGFTCDDRRSSSFEERSALQSGRYRDNGSRKTFCRTSGSCGQRLGGAMMAWFRVYDALIGQSELLRKKQLKLTNVLRTSYDNRMVSRVVASVIVHELERDARPLSQKLSDSNPYKYATSKNSISEDFAKIMLNIETGWEEWTDFPMESICALLAHSSVLSTIFTRLRRGAMSSFVASVAWMTGSDNWRRC